MPQTLSSSATHIPVFGNRLTIPPRFKGRKKKEEAGVQLVDVPLETSSSNSNSALSSSSSVPFHQEEVTMEEVMQQGIFATFTGMAADDLFDLTMCSEDAKNQVPALLLGVTRINFNGGQFSVFVANRDFDTDETKFELDIIDRQRSQGKLKRLTNFLRHRMLRKLMDRKINGVDYQIEKNNCKDYSTLALEGGDFPYLNIRKKFIIFSNIISEGYKDVLTHLFDIFPNEAPLFHLNLRGIRPDQAEFIQNLLSFEQIRECESLGMTIRNNEFVATAHKVMELMTELKNLFLDYGALDTEFFSPRMSSIDHLTVLYNRNAISQENLLSFNCETIKLWCPTITIDALNTFIKKWVWGDYGRLLYLEIPILFCLDDDDMEARVLNGLDVVPYDPERRAQWFGTNDWNYDYNCIGKPRHTDCRRGWDLERQTDGVLATIVVNPSFFYFFIWHDRFPEQPEHIPFCDE